MRNIKIIKVLCVYLLLTCVATTASVKLSFAAKGNGLYSSVSIENDIKTLDGTGQSVSEAAQRLIEAGSPVLEQAHAFLENKDASIQQKQALVIILGIITNENSIRYIIEAAESHRDELSLIISAINSLSYYERNREIEEFIYGLLDDNKNRRVMRDALVYLAQHPAEQDIQLADIYSKSETDLNVKSAALYLGGMLGMESYKNKIMETLHEREKKVGEGLMLMGLAALTTPGEFNALVKTEGMHLSHENIKIARLHYYLLRGSKDQQDQAAVEIVHEGYAFLKKDAIDYLIDNNDADALAHAWLNNDKTVKNMVNRRGLVITIDEQGARFADKADLVESEKSQSDSAVSEARDAFFRSIFQTFKNNDKDKFRSLALLNSVEYVRFLLTLAPAYTYEGGILKQYKIQFKESRGLVLDSWDLVYNTGLENNIEWAAARYVASNNKGGKYHQNTSFLLAYNGRYYKIEAPQIADIEGKSVLMSQLIWAGSRMDTRELLMWSQLAADENDAVAAKELKLLSNKTKSGTIPILRMLASYNSADDQYRLYELLKVSVSEKEKREAINWLRQSADNNLAHAQYELSEVLMADWYENTDAETLKEARKYLLLSVGQSSVYALKRIAEHYSIGSAGFDFDLDKAIQYNQALLDLDVKTLDKDEATLYKFFEQDIRDKLAEVEEQKVQIHKNNLQVITELALKQLDNHTVSSKRNGYIMLSEAADNNYPEAQYQLGKIYIKGDEIVPKDTARGVSLWQQASSQGHMKATEALAYGYIDGKFDIGQNVEKGLSLADKLAHYHASNLVNNDYEMDAARIWRVHACDLEIKISRMKNPAYVIPRVKTGRCKGL